MEASRAANPAINNTTTARPASAYGQRLAGWPVDVPVELEVAGVDVAELRADEGLVDVAMVVDGWVEVLEVAGFEV